MTRRMERDTIYRCRRFSAETIKLCVRWYTTYRLSYRKGQHLLPRKREVRQPSLKKMWDCALNQASEPVLADGNCYPPLHQISRRAKRDRAEEFLKSEFRPVRYLRKISFGGSVAKPGDYRVGVTGISNCFETKYRFIDHESSVIHTEFSW